MFWRFVYNALALPIMFIGFHVAACFNRKFREGIIERRDVFEKLNRQLNDARNIEKTAWFHFTSVGEFEQTKPLIEAIYADTRIVLTFFSPSVAPNVESYPYVDAAVFLPFDTPRNAERLIDLIQPTCLIFSRYDIWPNLVWKASKYNIPTIIIAGTVQSGSKRLSLLARSFFRSVHRHITLHCAISEDDAARFQQLGSTNEQVVVTGDTRYEQVYGRALSIAPDTVFFHGQDTLKHPILIAGSTYSDDEAVVFEAYQILRKDIPDGRLHLILVPHEPTLDRITEIKAELNKKKITYLCYSELSSDVNLESMDVLIVDTVGILAKLYQLADIAFVGGSFHGSVHNVMEPAAMAKPILFGPTIQNAYETSLLLEKGAAKLVHTPQQMAKVITEWLDNSESRITTGNIGKQLVEENLGAVERTLEHLRKYV
ncbi:MAG: hypothetical protein OXD54_01200 [Candidatus Poribacteria bacterium]|nr:hypothetical protein [Candidatus Poribacteria bacterium]